MSKTFLASYLRLLEAARARCVTHLVLESFHSTLFLVHESIQLLIHSLGARLLVLMKELPSCDRRKQPACTCIVPPSADYC